MVSDSIATAQLSRFLGAIFFFHGSEYALAVAFHGRSNVSLGSLLISKEYVAAMACSLMEYLIEYALFPELKNHWWFCNFGLLMVLLGEVIRKSAIITAGRSFTHNIRIYYEDEHELVTHGIYRFMRHPSYCGFFIWATGTQVMMSNPICIVIFIAVTWNFFSKRIPYPFLKYPIGGCIIFVGHILRACTPFSLVCLVSTVGYAVLTFIKVDLLTLDQYFCSALTLGSM